MLGRLVPGKRIVLGKKDTLPRKRKVFQDCKRRVGSGKREIGERKETAPPSIGSPQGGEGKGGKTDFFFEKGIQFPSGALESEVDGGEKDEKRPRAAKKDIWKECAPCDLTKRVEQQQRKGIHVQWQQGGSHKKGSRRGEQTLARR